MGYYWAFLFCADDVYCYKLAFKILGLTSKVSWKRFIFLHAFSSLFSYLRQFQRIFLDLTLSYLCYVVITLIMSNHNENLITWLKRSMTAAQILAVLGFPRDMRCIKYMPYKMCVSWGYIFILQTWCGARDFSVKSAWVTIFSSFWPLSSFFFIICCRLHVYIIIFQLQSLLFSYPKAETYGFSRLPPTPSHPLQPVSTLWPPLLYHGFMYKSFCYVSMKWKI